MTAAIATQAGNTEPAPGQTDVLSGPLRVLVVDDSKLQRRLFIAHLKRWGFSILEASSGQEALDICTLEAVDMILSDWMMPGMTGLEFCRAFRQMERQSYGYFILLTSKSEKDDVAAGLDIGADDFLTKPVNAIELRARIEAGRRVLAMENALQDQIEQTQAALDEIQTLYEAINKDLKEAEKLQKSLIPPPLKHVNGADISNMFRSSSHVGGDLVGHFELAENRYALYSIDVSGHGVSSALLTIRLAGYFSPHNRAQNVAFQKIKAGDFVIRGPAEIASKLNRLMLEELDTELYFTIAYAEIDMLTGRAILVQAGHPHPVIQRCNGQTEFVGAGGPPIGLISDLPFEEFEVTLTPGDRLLLYSDGVTECEDRNGALFDDDGLSGVLRKHQTSRGPELLDDVLWELAHFAGGSDFGDDVSCILFEYGGVLGVETAMR